MGLLERTKRVYFDDSSNDDWVDMRPLSIGELRDFRQRVAGVVPLTGEEEAEAQGYELSRLVLGACIVSWSDEAPVTEANIARLPYEFTFKLTDAAGLGGKKDEEVPLPIGSDSSVSSPEKTEQPSPVSG